MRPAFGVARPMKSGEGSGSAAPVPMGGEQFPPLPTLDAADAGANNKSDALSRLADRANGVASRATRPKASKLSVHKIKEQVLPRLLERVDPEAAATLTKEELSEEFRPIIMRSAGRTEGHPQPARAVRTGKVLIDELLGFGPLEELLERPGYLRHHGRRAGTDLYRKEGQADHRADPVPR